MEPREAGRQAQDAGVRRRPQQVRTHGPRRPHQNQERNRPLSHIQKVRPDLQVIRLKAQLQLIKIWFS